MSLQELAARARSLVRTHHRAILGITGAPGAGKTTLAERLVDELLASPPDRAPDDADAAAPWVAHLPMDGFHLADVELDRLGRRDRKGAPETFDPAGYAALLHRLRQDEDGVVYAPSFERELEQPLAGAIPVPPSVRLVITEGNYLLLEDGCWPRVREQLDQVWYCDLDDETRVARLVARHERFGKDHRAALAWAVGTDQRNADLIARTRALADLVIPVAALSGVLPTG